LGTKIDSNFPKFVSQQNLAQQTTSRKRNLATGTKLCKRNKIWEREQKEQKDNRKEQKRRVEEHAGKKQE
jgi:hypothetical protein